MAACGSLQHIFEKPLPENPTLLESLSSWNQIKSMKPIDDSSFTELFGELHFQEKSHADSSSPLPLSSPSSSFSSSSLSSPSFLDANPQAAGIERHNNERNKSPAASYYPTSQTKNYRHSDSFSSMNSESLSLCTEGLGFESSDDVEDLKNDISLDLQQRGEEKRSITKDRQSENSCIEYRRSRVTRGSFPPPISCIGRNGKPWVCFKSYRQDGRFILKEIRFPTQEFLHACREDGRLKLQFIQSDDEIIEEDDEEEQEVDDDDLEDIDEADEEQDEYEQNAEEEQKEAKNGVQITSNNIQGN